MEPNKTHNSQATQHRPPSKLSIMERASPGQEMLEVGKDKVEDTDKVEVNGPRLNTPPTSSAEVCSPASSSKRGQLRAASLGGSPSAGRGFGNPYTGFGAGLRNVPSPIATTINLREIRPLEPTNADAIFEPLQAAQLPGIAETLKDFAPSPANQPPITLPERPAAAADDVSVVPQSVSGLPDRSSLGNDANNGVAGQLPNFYARRADQIGPSHRIPGIGHLRDLLPPPGWKQGDNPISEVEAQRIYAVSRDQAKEMLDHSMSEISHLSGAEQEKVTMKKNTKYQTQRLLDEFLLQERAKLYHFWYDRTQKPSQQKHAQSQSQSHRRFEAKLGARPQPLQPPAQTSMIAYQRHQQSLVPASPHLYAPSPPLSGGTLNARINFMMQSLHIPQASPMSPTFLDPGLVPQTLEAVYNCYARNQVIIMNMNNENERFLTQWSAKFNVPRPKDSVAPSIIPFITGQRAAPFGTVHYGYMPQEPRPGTPSQVRRSGTAESATQTQHVRQKTPGSNLAKPRPGNVKALSHPAHRNGPFRYPEEQTSAPQRRPQVATTPETKKRGRTPKADKQKTWYADEIAEANLPTSVISQAAMKAGIDFMSNEDRKHTPPKPKGRRGMPVIDAKKGFVVSADAARALIAKGAADARPIQRPGALETSANQPAAIIAPSTGAAAGSQEAFGPSAGDPAMSVPTLQRDEDTISAPNSAASGPSSDTPDDPKDTNYGQRALRKPATSNTSAAPRKAASTAGKKRKSTEAAPPSKKRTRHSVDGAEEDE